MRKETEAIDRLFLELSQFTRATTARESELTDALKGLQEGIRALVKTIPKEGLGGDPRAWEQLLFALVSADRVLSNDARSQR